MHKSARKIPIHMRNKAVTGKGAEVEKRKAFVIENMEGLGRQLSVYGRRLTKRIPISTSEEFIGGRYNLLQYSRYYCIVVSVPGTRITPRSNTSMFIPFQYAY